VGDLFAVVVLTVNMAYALIVKWENPRFYICAVLVQYSKNILLGSCKCNIFYKFEKACIYYENGGKQGIVFIYQ